MNWHWKPPRRRQAACRFPRRGRSGDRRRETLHRAPAHASRRRNTHEPERRFRRPVGVYAHEPIGVVLAYSAFNHPLNLIVHQVGPAIAAGCPVIVKPAKATPLSCFRFVGILREAGLPPEWCQAMMTASKNSPPRGRRPPVGFLFLHRQRRGGLEFAVEIGPRRALLAGTRRRGPGHRRRRCRSGRRFAATLQRRLLPRGPGLRFGAADLRRPEDRPGSGRPSGRTGRQLKVGDPTLPETEVGPLIRARKSAASMTGCRKRPIAERRSSAAAKAVGTRCYAPRYCSIRPTIAV